MKIYQVIQSKGEYMDYDEDVIGTYLNRDKAERIKAECDEILKPLKEREEICEECQETDEFRDTHSDNSGQKALETVLKRCKRSELYLADMGHGITVLRCTADKQCEINEYFIREFEVDES